MATMATSTNQSSVSASLTLESLPAEIIQGILDFLVPDRPEIGETRPVSYNALVPGEAWYEFTRRRHGLRSLCLVSKKFREVVQPLLYRVVAILDEESLILFFRAVLLRPDLVASTRHFSCHLTLTRHSVSAKVRRALVTHHESFPMADSIDVGAMLAPVDGVDLVPEFILGFILVRLTRMEILLLQVPLDDEHPQYTMLLADLVVIRSRCANNPGSIRLDPGDHLSHSDAPLPDQIPFMHLETLLLQGDPELREEIDREYEIGEGDGFWGVETLRYDMLLSILPKLTTLEVTADDGYWDWEELVPQQLMDNPLHNPFDSPLKNIRHIFLHDSIASPRNLYHIMRGARKLETLYMTPRQHDCPEEDDWPPPDGTEGHPESLDNALIKYGKNLRHLDLSWFDIFERGDLIGPEGRLASLPTLKKLEKLCVQLAVLYGTELPIDEDNNSAMVGLLPPLSDVLPPNIVELTLEDWWWSNYNDWIHMTEDPWEAEDRLQHYRAKKPYRENALQILMQFARDSATTQPLLKKVLLLCRIPYTWMVENGLGIEFHFHEVKKAFGERGVEFLVEEA